MKKIILTILSILVLFTNIQMVTFAEEQQVEGLHEKLNALFIKNNFTEEQILDMEQQYLGFYDKKWAGHWKGMSILGKTKYKDEELEYEYVLNKERPNFDYGILVTLLPNKQNSKKYFKEYIDNNVLYQLFSKEQYWEVLPEKDGNVKNRCLLYDIGGVLLGYDLGECWGIKEGEVLITNENIDFLKNELLIKEKLLEKSETKVNDIKIFGIQHNIIFVFLKCAKNEYLMILHLASSLNLKFKNKFEQYKLYPASEVINALAQEWDYIATDKPTYETEALSLQSEGLLNGNDNGLDLLKPLTRIEAAAMLLRAIGETEIAPEGATQAFNDVPSTHWGFGAAINAQSLGIVNGVGDNNFAPDKTVTATEFSTMVLRAANTGEFDWTQALDMLIEQGIITEENSETMDLFTRGDMAKIIYEARNKGLLH